MNSFFTCLRTLPSWSSLNFRSLRNSTMSAVNFFNSLWKFFQFAYKNPDTILYSYISSNGSWWLQTLEGFGNITESGKQESMIPWGHDNRCVCIRNKYVCAYQICMYACRYIRGYMSFLVVYSWHCSFPTPIIFWQSSHEWNILEYSIKQQSNQYHTQQIFHHLIRGSQ